MRPGLLTHPTIPVALHGVAPRSILGKRWWDKTRVDTYDKAGRRCQACGSEPGEGGLYGNGGRLEAHECYNINYDTGVVLLDEIVALCALCHRFVHSGRLRILYESDVMTHSEVMKVLDRGMKILHDANLQPFAGTYLLYEELKGTSEVVALQEGLEIPDESKVQWSEWHLVLEGKKYYSLYSSREEWHEYWRLHGV